MRRALVGACCIALAILAPACRREEQARAPARAEAARDSFLVAITSTRGPFSIAAHHDWAPQGAERFYQLVKSGYYDDACFFRVIPGFVAQFGLARDPALSGTWSARPIPDDSVRRSNRHGTVSFASAGPGTRTTQLFINLADNQRLDAMGFPPIGAVVEGLAAVDSLNTQYGERPAQDSIRLQGNKYLRRHFPRLDCIRTARVAREWP